MLIDSFLSLKAESTKLKNNLIVSGNKTISLLQNTLLLNDLHMSLKSIVQMYD